MLILLTFDCPLQLHFTDNPQHILTVNCQGVWGNAVLSFVRSGVMLQFLLWGLGLWFSFSCRVCGHALVHFMGSGYALILVGPLVLLPLHAPSLPPWGGAIEILQLLFCLGYAQFFIQSEFMVQVCLSDLGRGYMLQFLFWSVEFCFCSYRNQRCQSPWCVYTFPVARKTLKYLKPYKISKT